MGQRGVATMDQVSAGEAGGIFAGVVALLYALGRGVGWVWTKIEGRIDKRAAENVSESERLGAWRKALDHEAKALREGIKAELEAVKLELAEVRLQSVALAAGLLDVALELDGHAPQSPALARLGETLRQVWKVSTEIPPEMAVLLARLEKKGAGNGGKR